MPVHCCGHGPQSGRGEPGVEHGAVGGDRSEAVAPGRARVHVTSVASGTHRLLAPTALGAGIAVVASLAIPGIAALAAVPRYFSDGSSVGTARPGSAGGWWVDTDTAKKGSFALGASAPAGGSALGLSLPDPGTTDKVYLYHSYPTADRPDDVSALLDGASYTYAGTNVNSQIEMIYQPADAEEYGPDGTTPCVSPSATEIPGGAVPDAPAGWCYTSIKWEPFEQPTSWKTVDLSDLAASANSEDDEGGWRNIKRVGSWEGTGGFGPGNGSFEDYLDQMADYRVTSFVLGTGSGTGPATAGWVQSLVLGGAVQSFGAPAAITLDSGDSIQSAIDSIAPGGVISLNPGVYKDDLRITKSLTLKGLGSPGSVVIMQRDSAGEYKLIDVYGTSDVTLENLSLQRNPLNDRAATGIDANSVAGLTLKDVSVDGMGKNGISVTGKWAAISPETSSDIRFENVSVTDNAWAGIAFYTKSTQDVNVDISEVTFAGTTTVSGNGTGIQFGDAGDANRVTGADDGPVSLGTVIFSDNDQSVAVNDHSTVQLARASTVDGAAVRSADVPGVTVLPVVATSVSLSVSPSGSVTQGASVTVTGTVSPSSAGGTIAIKDGPVTLGSGAVSGGVFAVTTTSLAVGSHALTAVFTPSDVRDYAASASSALPLTVSAPAPVATSVSLSVSPSGSVTQGASVTVTGTVSPSSAAGTIAIKDGSATLGSGAVSGGVFAVTTTSLAVGSHALTAVFTPSDAARYAASSSTVVTMSVTAKPTPPPAPTPTSTPAPTPTEQPTVTTPPPPPATEAVVIADLGASGEELLERYAQANDGAAPPPAAEVLTLPAGEDVDLNAFDPGKKLQATIPWTDDSGDSWVDVWAYSSPVFIGTFPVIDGVLHITGADLSKLGAGEHHLAFVGQTSGKSEVVAMKVAEPTPPDAPEPGQATTEPTPGPTAIAIDSDGAADLAWLPWTIGGVLVLAAAVALVLVARRRRA